MKLVIEILSLVFLLILNSCGGKAQPQESRTDGTSVRQQSTKVLLDSLTEALKSIEKKSIIPGFAVAIVDEEKVVYQKGVGYSNLKDSISFSAGTINFIASISKTFIGLSVMKMVEMGELSLDEPINNILPYSIQHPLYKDAEITIRQLVTHTASLTADFDPEDVGEADIFLLENKVYEEDSIQAFMDKELAYYKLGKKISLGESVRNFLSKDGRWYSESNFLNNPPGTKFSYSNLGSELAAHIVEIRSGLSFDAFTQKYIFEPLGMENTAWFYKNLDHTLLSEIYMPDDWDNPTRVIEHPKYQYVGYPAGDLKTNIQDLSLYLMEMINGMAGKGKLLNAVSYQILFAPQLDDSYFEEKRDGSPLNDEYDIGIFWAVSSKGYRMHNGGSIGVYSFLYFDPQTKSGAIGFSNLPDGSFGQIRDAVYECERKIFADK